MKDSSTTIYGSTIDPSLPSISPNPLSTAMMSSAQPSTVYVTVYPTGATQTISTIYSIIGGSALAGTIVASIIICIIAAIISYKCGRSIERKHNNMGHRERSTTELIANELYKTNSTNITDEAYAELKDLYPVTEEDSYSKLKHNQYSEVEPTYSKIQHETDQKTQAIGVVESSRAYTSLIPVTLDKPSNYDVASPNGPHPVSSDTSCL